MKALVGTRPDAREVVRGRGEGESGAVLYEKESGCFSVRLCEGLQEGWAVRRG